MEPAPSGRLSESDERLETGQFARRRPGQYGEWRTSSFGARRPHAVPNIRLEMTPAARGRENCLEPAIWCALLRPDAEVPEVSRHTQRPFAFPAGHVAGDCIADRVGRDGPGLLHGVGHLTSKENIGCEWF